MKPTAKSCPLSQLNVCVFTPQPLKKSRNEARRRKRKMNMETGAESAKGASVEKKCSVT